MVIAPNNNRHKQLPTIIPDGTKDDQEQLRDDHISIHCVTWYGIVLDVSHTYTIGKVYLLPNMRGRTKEVKYVVETKERWNKKQH